MDLGENFLGGWLKVSGRNESTGGVRVGNLVGGLAMLIG